MESSQFLWRRLEAARPLRRATISFYLVNVLFLAFVFQDGLPEGLAVGWATVSLVLGGAWFAVGEIQKVSRGPGGLRVQLASSALFALALGLSYSWFFVVAFPRVSSAGQLVLGGFTGAVAVLGSLAMAPLLSVAGAWVVGLAVGVLGVLVEGGGWFLPGTWLLLADLALGLALVLVAIRKKFRGQLQAEAEVDRQTQLASLLLHDFGEGTQDWTWEADPAGRLKQVTPRLAQQLGRPASDLEGHPLAELLVEDEGDLTIEEEEDLETLAGQFASLTAFHDLEIPVQIQGSRRQWKLSGRPQIDNFGTVAGWWGVGSDVTEVRRINELNARLELLDNLTGLANRHRLQAVLHDNLTPRGGVRPCGLILIDVRNFRMVNEGLGHDVGDDLLREITRRLRTRVPPSALLARFGGDEFALVAPGAGEAALEGLVSALSSATEEPFQVADHRLELFFHMGVAACPRDAIGAAELLKCAELALHQAKLTRQGQAVVYQPAFGQLAQDRIRLHAELKTALVEQQFELHYQPQVRASDGAIVGCEALVRWRHPTRGLVSPAEFIPALEEIGLIVPVGILILEMACREALSWPQDQVVAVNVSAVQFASRFFLESVEGVLRNTGFPAARLELEITESVMAQDPKLVVQTLKILRAQGVSISLDDFGTGYSSLSYLRILPLDKLKVDQSFVRVMGQDPKAASIVRTVLELSRLLGLKTTAEGVETEDQRDRLRAMGCDSIQGYLYSKPLPALALAEFRASRG